MGSDHCPVQLKLKLRDPEEIIGIDEANSASIVSTGAECKTFPSSPKDPEEAPSKEEQPTAATTPELLKEAAVEVVPPSEK